MISALKIAFKNSLNAVLLSGLAPLFLAFIPYAHEPRLVEDIHFFHRFNNIKEWSNARWFFWVLRISAILFLYNLFFYLSLIEIFYFGHHQHFYLILLLNLLVKFLFASNCIFKFCSSFLHMLPHKLGRINQT